jgi:two-component sensor histidine kinase
MILDIDTITPLGIIINELIVNILKHAFVENSENPQISISLHKKDDILELKVADNGKGIDLKERKEKSFGLKLIKSLSRKLKADLKITNNNGALVELKIKRFVIK